MTQFLPLIEFSQALFDAVPIPILIVDEDMRLMNANAVGAQLLGSNQSLPVLQRGGDVLHCIHAVESDGGCGTTEYCKDCVIRNSVTEASKGKHLVRQKLQMELVTNGKRRQVDMMVTTAPFELNHQRLVLLILEDMSEVAVLRNLLPICAKCKKIRDDRQYWHRLESYLAANLQVEFTHGLCPDCFKEALPKEALPLSPGQPSGPCPTSSI